MSRDDMHKLFGIHRKTLCGCAGEVEEASRRENAEVDHVVANKG